MEMSYQSPFKGEIESFNQLFREHYPALRAYAGLLVGDTTAEDVVQDVFLQTWQNRDTINIHTSVKAYLFKSVYNRSLNTLSSLKMRHGKQQEIEYTLKIQEALLCDPDKNPVIHKLYNNELRDEVHQAIESLPDKCREVFKLSYLDDYRNKEISEMMSISVSTVEKHINHALKTLRKTLLHLKALIMNFL
ncbi:RNA polymerase sigma-70 factor [Chitinophaga ginsengisegetis]|uniref:RNA polymerase sigma-70 factor n=1 Tax=Chitinophaga ginsengisegetis TaxID=393003 RepID=UPI000DB9C604|nr:RNA polymerase sigma-70 factor [Chitinophaga ginsengisegetis]MDR6565638.1 RNA polymerase sigma-70 factor (ECF subfamily) [Chitinophaga ginsengisegetis]MDR6645367.1 RNA polymerase sigma-70 factor (ECF subfamily) [Chitinophaga ginsengisegetis]MDR6652042.1 RNA polymerase sigma-70 factor (ECF subfamily) [Chitinophaga ginsengisegetis]